MHLTQQTLGATELQLLNYPQLYIEEARGIIITCHINISVLRTTICGDL